MWLLLCLGRRCRCKDRNRGHSTNRCRQTFQNSHFHPAFPRFPSECPVSKLISKMACHPERSVLQRSRRTCFSDGQDEPFVLQEMLPISETSHELDNPCRRDYYTSVCGRIWKNTPRAFPCTPVIRPIPDHPGPAKAASCRPLHCLLRYFVFRTVIFALLFASAACLLRSKSFLSPVPLRCSCCCISRIKEARRKS